MNRRGLYILITAAVLLAGQFAVMLLSGSPLGESLRHFHASEALSVACAAFAVCIGISGSSSVRKETASLAATLTQLRPGDRLGQVSVSNPDLVFLTDAIDDFTDRSRQTVAKSALHAQD